jgi:hypothetical protein
MDGYRLIDTHTHTKGVSLCAEVTCEELIDQKMAMGYDGCILTNHCQPHYYAPTAENHAAYIENAIAEYKRALPYAKERGFIWMLGIEVTILDPFYADWQLYGVTEEFLRNTPCLHALSQRELFAVCEKWGVMLVQAHPWRDNLSYCDDQHPGEKGFLHGVEINCTWGDRQHKDKVLATAEEYGVVVTCGTDYHSPHQDFVGGMYLPNWVRTSVDFASYLRETEETVLKYGDEVLKIPNFSKKLQKN